MAAVSTIKPHLSSIQCPAELSSLEGWLMWRYEQGDDGQKPRKVPYYVNGQRRQGKQGSPEDRRHLATFGAARAAAARRGMDGVGLALLPDWGLTALDFDHCVLPSGELHPEVAEIAAQSYAEWSPSGSGVRVLFKGNLLNRKSFEEPYGFETFSTKGFVTFTGNRLDITEVLGNENTVAEVTDTVLGLFTRRFGRPEKFELDVTAVHDDEILGLTEDEMRRALIALADERHDPWIQGGMAAHHETRGEGFELWDECCQASSKYPGREKLQQRWESFSKQEGPAITGRTLVHLAAERGVYIGHHAQEPATAFDDLTVNADGTPKPLKYQFQPLGALLTAKPLGWIVKGLLPKAQLGVIYGASGSGKSFVALDLAMSIARGEPWRGRRVTQMPVAYVIAEGSAGFKKRVEAYAMRHGIQPDAVPIHGLAAAPNLGDTPDTKELIKGLQAIGGVGLVVIDTLAQVTPGADENTGKDMNPIMKRCQAISAATGALVLLVHHSGKDATRGARGWTGIRAALDVEIEVVRQVNGRFVRLTKSKDDIDGLEWGFDLDIVPVGIDDDGDEITSCVVREAEVPKAVALDRKLGAREKVVMAAFQTIAEAQTEGIEVEAVVEEALGSMEVEPEKRSKAKANLRATLRNLLKTADSGIGEAEDGTLYVC